MPMPTKRYRSPHNDSTQMNISVPLEYKKHLQLQAFERGVTFSVLVRGALMDHYPPPEGLRMTVHSPSTIPPEVDLDTLWYRADIEKTDLEPLPEPPPEPPKPKPKPKPAPPPPPTQEEKEAERTERLRKAHKNDIVPGSWA